MNRVAGRRLRCLLFAIVPLLAAGCQAEPSPIVRDSQPDVAANPPVSPAVSSPTPPAAEATDSSELAGPPLHEAPTPLDQEDLSKGWIALFDGHSLYGWKAATEANWRVEDGAIVVDGGQPGLLCTATQFGDYVLRVEFRSAPETNSGIFLHTPIQPTDPAQDCYELNIADSDNPFPTCSLVKRVKTPGDFDSSDWQSYEIKVAGDRLTVSLDGKEVLDYTDERPLRRGHIGLQLNDGRVEFRNIHLKPLGMTSIFNGQDLQGWKTYPEMDSEFTVTDEGWLHVANGRGQLETEGVYDDFVLQLQCLTHAPGLNSGIFFRCIPGDVMMGYESQIENRYEGGDRRRPVDHGTGGIFRRAPARVVAADDQQWFHKTIIADGAHIATWVNGYQVVDWTDTRAPHENPRQGLRLAAGSLMIQGHDPTTDISFRGLQVSELAPRASVVEPE